MIQVFFPLSEVSQILFEIPEGFYFESKLETFVKDQGNIEILERIWAKFKGQTFS